MSAWHWPQSTLAILIAFEVVLKISKHGEERPPYNGPLCFLDALFMCWLLWAGGFWG